MLTLIGNQPDYIVVHGAVLWLNFKTQSLLVIKNCNSGLPPVQYCPWVLQKIRNGKNKKVYPK